MILSGLEKDACIVGKVGVQCTYRSDLNGSDGCKHQEINMDYAAFSTIEASKAHRKNHGGWIFDAGNIFIWFRLGFTPSTIFMHPATAGMSGKLI